MSSKAATLLLLLFLCSASLVGCLLQPAVRVGGTIARTSSSSTMTALHGFTRNFRMVAGPEVISDSKARERVLHNLTRSRLARDQRRPTRNFLSWLHKHSRVVDKVWESKHRTQSISSVELERVFALFDADDNGLDLHELAKLVQALGQTWEADYIHNLLTRIDTNADGVISFEEFKTWFRTPFFSEHMERNLELKEGLQALSQILNVRFARDAALVFPSSFNGKVCRISTS